jgi:hypothetical protein
MLDQNFSRYVIAYYKSQNDFQFDSADNRAGRFLRDELPQKSQGWGRHDHDNYQDMINLALSTIRNYERRLKMNGQSIKLPSTIFYKEVDASMKVGLGDTSTFVKPSATSSTMDGYKEDVFEIDIGNFAFPFNASTVRKVQEALRERGYLRSKAQVDGVFGKNTAEAVKRLMWRGGHPEGKITFQVLNRLGVEVSAGDIIR